MSFLTQIITIWFALAFATLPFILAIFAVGARADREAGIDPEGRQGRAS